MSESPDWVKCSRCANVMLGPVTECEKCGYKGKRVNENRKIKPTEK